MLSPSLLRRGPLGHGAGALSVGLALALAGCSTQSTPAVGSTGRVAIDVAPLNLAGVGYACYDLAVSNGSETVWSRGNPLLTRLGADETGGTASGAPDTETLCSNAYGDGGGGSLSFVGTCDADADADAATPGVQNRVTVWVDGLYDASGASDLGDWRDPCPGGCTLDVDCAENTDTPVTFDLTVMRQAQQGFFDISVNFDNIFCSAKLDTCYGSDPDSTPIRLLFGADGARDHTAVFAFACTAGLAADVDTTLLYGAVAVDCGALVFPLEPTAAPGNQSVTVSGKTLHYAVYRGTEALDCGATSCHKQYWNLAIDLDDLVTAAPSSTCGLAFQGTAADNATGFPAGLPANSDEAYPYIDVDATLSQGGVAACQTNPLDGPGSAVTTVYRGAVTPSGAPMVMCGLFHGDSAAATQGVGCAACPPGSIDDPGAPGTCCGAPGEPCCTGGATACAAPYACDATSSTCACADGFDCDGVACCAFGQFCTDGSCATPPAGTCQAYNTTVRDGGVCLSAPCPATCLEILHDNPAALSGVYQLDPDGPGGAAPFPARCDMTFDGGGWTLIGFEDAGQPNPNTSNGAMRFLGADTANPAAIAAGIGAGIVGTRFTRGTDYVSGRLNWCDPNAGTPTNFFARFDTPTELFDDVLRNSAAATIPLSSFFTNDAYLDSLVTNTADARFCKAATLAGNYPGDTSWGIKGSADLNFGCGCNSGGWAGVGSYYGGTQSGQQTSCTGWGGGWAGSRANGQQKGSYNSFRTHFWIR